MSPSLGARQVRQICREKNIVCGGDNNIFSLQKYRSSKYKPIEFQVNNYILDKCAYVYS